MGNDPNMCAKKQKIEDGNSISRQHSEGTACADTDLSEFSLMDLLWLINFSSSAPLHTSATHATDFKTLM
jgi:hypothetical protein